MTNIDQHHIYDRTLNYSYDTGVEWKHIMTKNGSHNNVKSVNSITKQYLKYRFMFRCTERGNDVDSVTRQKNALYWNRIDPVFSPNQQAAMTVKSVGLVPALTFNCSRSASVSPPFVRETKDVSTETQAQVSRAMAGVGGHSGCTCERLQDQFQQTVLHWWWWLHRLSTTHAGGGGVGGGNRLCRYLPAKGV